MFSVNKPEDINVIVAQYGNRDNFTETDAMHVFSLLKAQEQSTRPHKGYYLSDIRILGDRQSGMVTAIAKYEE